MLVRIRASNIDDDVDNDNYMMVWDCLIEYSLFKDTFIGNNAYVLKHIVHGFSFHVSILDVKVCLSYRSFLAVTQRRSVCRSQVLWWASWKAKNPWGRNTIQRRNLPSLWQMQIFLNSVFQCWQLQVSGFVLVYNGSSVSVKNWILFCYWRFFSV